MEEVIKRVRDLSATANEADRKDILLSLRDLAYSIESPDDTMGRILFSHLQISGVRVGVDLGIFNLLAASDIPLSCEALAHIIGADSSLLGRLLRYLASVGMIKESASNNFEATSVSKTLASAGNQAGICHYFDTVGPQFQELPKYLADTNYADITDANKTVFQSAYKTNLSNFAWLSQHPKAFEHLNQHMAARRRGMPTWLSVFPVEERVQGWVPTHALFVDIGGGIGHQCAEFVAKHPNLTGRIILQDLQYSIDNALPTTGVERTVHDFFHPQPVHGAKFYYMRGILHDFPDDKCRIILQNTVAAMGTESLILIDDMVLPDTNAHWQATQVDITMMCALAAMERTKTQWEALLDSVGLKIVERHVYTPGSYESVTVAVPR